MQEIGLFVKQKSWEGLEYHNQQVYPQAKQKGKIVVNLPPKEPAAMAQTTIHTFAIRKVDGSSLWPQNNKFRYKNRLWSDTACSFDRF